MPILPKSREKYLAALRNHIHFSINRYGILPKHYAAYKKIMLSEIFCLEREKVPVDIIKLSDSILGAAVILLLRKGRWFSTELTGSGVFLADTKFFSAVLLEVCNGFYGDGAEISVSVKENAVYIKACCCRTTPTLERLIQKSGAVLLKYRTENIIAIKIYAESTNEKAAPFPEDWQLVTDRFSIVRVFLSLTD